MKTTSKNKTGRQPYTNLKWRRPQQKKWRRPRKKNKTTSKKIINEDDLKKIKTEDNLKK